MTGFQEYNLYTTRPQGPINVPETGFLVGKAKVNDQGQGLVDAFIPSAEKKLHSLFDNPIEIRDDSGKLQQTLKPWSKEAINYLMQKGLASEGLTAVPQPKSQQLPN